MTESVGDSISLDPLLPLATKVDFSYQPLTSYTMDSSNASSQVSDGGSTLKLSNTASKKVDFIYNVTANTVLQFEFRSDAIGKVSAIGFDNDNNFWNTNWGNSTGFKLSGSDQWTGWNQALNNYNGTEWRTYSLNIGKNYTGPIQYLFFHNSPNTTSALENSFFRNVQLYDINPLDTIAPTVASVNAPTITTSTKDYSFNVSYTDSVLMNAGSLDSKDIRVTSANGFNQIAQFVSSTTSADGKTVVGTYKISSNLGWGINDKNGVYTVSLEGNQVGDYNYNLMAAQTLGTFNINVGTIVPGSNLTPSSPITINPSLLSNYTMGGMSADEVNISQDGTLQLSGDLWTKLDFAYNVTPYTVLEFQFRSDAMGYAHVIGFDNDNIYWDNANSNKPTGFKLYGTETWSGWNQPLNNYSGTDWKSYSFKIGDLFTGAMNYLFFVNTNLNGTSGNSFFRNIRVYDTNSLDISAPTTGVSIANSTVTNGTNFVNANSEYQFTVTYSDASGINLATLDNNDIKVQAPNGTLQNATLVSTTSSSDRKTVTATYKIFDGGSLNGDQNNAYSLLLQANQVSDLNNNFLGSQTIGGFTVEYSSLSSTTQQLLNSQSEFKFNVSYYSSNGIDVTSLDNGDLQVTGPNNFQKAANFVSVQKKGSNEWIATYKIVDNDGIWDAKNNGIYTINLQANQVRSIAGHSLTATSLGNLVINTQEKALWYSGFENGYPGGEWLNWDNGTYTANGQSTQNSFNSNWTTINQDQASQAGLLQVAGNSVYKGWINSESATDGDLHRSYPLIHVDPSGQWNPDTTFDDYLSSPAAPIVNRFYVYMDWDPSKISDSDWLSFMTVSNNTYWGIVGFSLRGAQGQLEMSPLAPWQTVTSTPAIMPSDRWVRFTTYMDFQTNLLYVWMDGTLIFKMTQGGNLNYTDGSNGQTGHLRRAHWGLYANGGFSDATVYNDSIQLWTVQSPITNPSQEPWSPYDGDGVDFVYSSDFVAPTVSNLNAPTITTSTQDYSFTVSYTDNILMYKGNLDSKDIRVTGANGFNQLAQFVSSTTSADGKTVVATYKITSNLGWGINDKNGIYTISLEGNQVGDYNYNFMAAQTLGTFNVNVGTIDPGSSLTASSPITINPSLLSNYTMGGMSPDEVNISPDGTLQLSGHLWTKLDFAYNVTQYTVLEFQFRSDAMGYAHVIGFDNDNSYWDNSNSNKTGFKLYGTETWPGWNQPLNNYSETDWKSYSFKIGDLFTGAMSYLFFVNTNTNGTSGNSFFRNIRVYDTNSLDISAPTTGVGIANSTVTNGTTFVNANSEYQFTVTYRDASGINLATLDNNDIKVQAPNGTLQNATLVSTTSSSDRKTVTATYKIFDVGIIGQYSIFLQENQVSDINYNFLASRNIGLFSVGTLYTSVESAGNTKLVKDSSNKFYAQVGDNTPVAIKNGTIQVYEGIYAGWQTLAAETINGVNQVLWKNAGSNTMQVWQMNNNWERVSTQSITLNSSAALAQETVFRVDANGDGTIGTLYTSVESAGNTKLVKDSSNKFYAQVAGNTPVAIKNSTTQIYEGISAGWQILGVETVNGVNQVLWKNAGSNAMNVWQMNSSWERVSNQIIGTLTSSAALAQEIIFGVDANGDGIIG